MLEPLQNQMDTVGSYREEPKVTAAFGGTQAHWLSSDLPAPQEVAAITSFTSEDTDVHTVRNPAELHHI